MPKLTTEEFIKKAREVHGDKYDYSKGEYVNAQTLVDIICPKHGEFMQRPSAHLRGAGCPKCGIQKNIEKATYSKGDFIRLAKKRHGDKYDYSKVNYIDYDTKVCIICPIHGEFWQAPSSHVQRSGFPACSGREKLTTESFIEKAKKVHGDKYDYSKVVYKNHMTKVCIICPKHGEFWQRPNGHLRGAGCLACGIEYRNSKLALTKEEFLKRSRKAHGNKYDYSEVNYVNSSTKVCIVCPIHGKFYQFPIDHYKGCGCPSCAGNKKLDEIGFYEGARHFHGDKYDYSKVVFKTSMEKVCIICPKHGEFWQTPYNHALKGYGCSKCGAEERGIQQIIPIDNILTEAKRYKTIKEFKDANPTMYALAKRKKLDLSFLDREHHLPYSYEDVMNLARKCKYVSEFERTFAGAYNKARIMGWLKDMTWFELPEMYKGDLNAKNHIVYVYEDTIGHAAYIGLTDNLKRRHREHVRNHKNGKNSKVYVHFHSKGLDIPAPKVLESNVTAMDSRELEDFWLQKYRHDGWTIINVAKTGRTSGSIGGFVRIWTVEAIKQEAAKYTTKAEFEKANPSAYAAALQKKIMKELSLLDVKPARLPVRNIETGEVFPSLSAASKKYNVSPDYIGYAAKGKRESYAGYHWEFVEDNKNR